MAPAGESSRSLRPVASIVLAAGRGERFGGPKALLAWPSSAGPIPLAWAHAQAHRAAGVAHVLVVTREPVAAVLERLGRPEGAELVVSHEPDAVGPAGSLAAAVRALAPRWPSDAVVLVTPVDCPPATAATVAAVLAALGGTSVAARPRFEGRGGHPVALGTELLVRRYGGAERPPLREVLRAEGGRVVEVDSDDPRVPLDIDSQGDLLRLVERRLLAHADLGLFA